MIGLFDEDCGLGLVVLVVDLNFVWIACCGLLVLSFVCFVNVRVGVDFPLVCCCLISCLWIWCFGWLLVSLLGCLVRDCFGLNYVVSLLLLIAYALIWLV